MSWHKPNAIRTLVVLAGLLLGCGSGDEEAKGMTRIHWDFSERDLPGIEPRIAYFDSLGNEVSAQYVERTTGRFKWTLLDEDSVHPGAIGQHRLGIAAGRAGNLEKAMKHFHESHLLAPRWAQPVYQAAWTALYEGDRTLAERLYEWTNRMVPRGYWTAKTALDCLQRECSGEFPRGAYLRYIELESEHDGDRRRAALERIVAMSPSFAPAWKDLAVLRASIAGKEEAIRRGLGSRPDAETRGFLLLHQAGLPDRTGKDAEVDVLLRGLLEDSAATLQTVALGRLMSASRGKERR